MVKRIYETFFPSRATTLAFRNHPKGLATNYHALFNVQLRTKLGHNKQKKDIN